MRDKLKTPCFRIVKSDNVYKDRGFKYTLEIYWGGLADEYIPIKHYVSRLSAKKELEKALDNYFKNKEVK